MYYVEDQESVLIHLEKINKQQWWENVLKHHPKIDVRKIVPENSKLSDLDGEMRYVCNGWTNQTCWANMLLQRYGGKDDGEIYVKFSCQLTSRVLSASSLTMRRRYDFA